SKQKTADYVQILTAERMAKEKRDTLAYLMIHLLKIAKDEAAEMDKKRICWELTPTIFGLRRSQILEFEISNPAEFQKYRQVFLALLGIDEVRTSRNF
ncbi:hypothetical protein PMAYCL1PPCAC_06200, partial [Pristionchus mayeri]